jgi:hypothetical protein
VQWHRSLRFNPADDRIRLDRVILLDFCTFTAIAKRSDLSRHSHLDSAPFYHDFVWLRCVLFALSSIEPWSMAPVDYTIPLCDYERKLLAQLAPSQTERAPWVGSEEFEAQSLSNQLLPHWQWARLVRGYFEDHFGEENLNQEYAGSKASAYKGFLHSLQFQDGFQQNLARARTLERANPDFLQLWGDQSIENVVLRPAVEDLPAWQTISLMYLDGELYWNLRSLFQTYHILKSVYTYGHRLNSKDNVDIVYGKLITHPTFTSIYKIRAVEKDKDSENSALPGAPGARESEYEFVNTRTARSPEQVSVPLRFARL